MPLNYNRQTFETLNGVRDGTCSLRVLRQVNRDGRNLNARCCHPEVLDTLLAAVDTGLKIEFCCRLEQYQRSSTPSAFVHHLSR
jgi:hypothetical protein